MIYKRPMEIKFKQEAEETENMSTQELQRLVLLEQLNVARLLARRELLMIEKVTCTVSSPYPTNSSVGEENTGGLSLLTFRVDTLDRLAEGVDGFEQQVSCETYEVGDVNEELERPTSEADWKAISQEFQCRWKFPHCIGSIDGKHVQTVAPQHSGSLFYNYKGTFSIVFLGVADAIYNFLYVDVGCQGRISDGGVFKCTSLYKDLENNTAHVPRSDALPGRTEPVPYVLVGDDAFAMSSYLMKPYPGRTLEIPKRMYNYRLSRAALRIIENVFGIMSSKFRVLLKPIALQPNKWSPSC
ncbi:unnamed protein product [Acanthoscelides obtectus]|uniref:DDE Tnp4 domain-containing protein n=1 Tax=Acanthoscelides obtectus TaxID=200917 RepID=A0A9P0PWR0_ACAOB|nr:unnamed protein product [Acanthoscelides obtectus]CAK1633662.1 Protein ALP1-like [Acanthoscelides obtectus]